MNHLTAAGSRHGKLQRLTSRAYRRGKKIAGRKEISETKKKNKDHKNQNLKEKEKSWRKPSKDQPSTGPDHEQTYPVAKPGGEEYKQHNGRKKKKGKRSPVSRVKNRPWKKGTRRVVLGKGLRHGPGLGR